MLLPIVSERIHRVKERNSIRLDLSGFGLKEIPFEVGELKQLKQLRLNGNDINKIEVLAGLENLEELHLNDNKIQNLDGLQHLSKLKRLFLINNHISDLQRLSKLVDLEVLYLGRNEIQDLKPLKSLHKLKQLSLFENLIDEVELLRNLSSLETLSLQHNEISDLPRFLLDLNQPILWAEDDQNNGVYVFGNPLQLPPEEIVKLGNIAIESYLNEAENEKTIPLHEAKMLVLGAAGVGKTSFVNKFINPDSSLAEADSSTVGIQISLYSKMFAVGDAKYQIKIWDFAGQLLYRSLHRLFLTRNSLYILLQDSRGQRTDLIFWLKQQQQVADNSPVIIIQNERYDTKENLPSKELKQKFENLKGCFSINLAKVSKGYRPFETIVTQIGANLMALAHIGDQWPEKRFGIRKALKDRSSDKYISVEEYQKICNSFRYQDKISQFQLLAQLHDLGDILHFQNTEYLCDHIFVDPQWLLDQIYRVFDHTKNYSKYSGSFARKDLKELFKKEHSSGMLDSIIELMLEFELCFEIEKKRHAYIVPLLLPYDEPEDFEWKYNHYAEIQYEYELLPLGLVPQLIVRFNNRMKNELRWRSGVVLQEEEGHYVFIKEDAERLRVRANSSNALSLFRSVISEIDDLNSNSATGGQVKDKLIPCHCSICRDSEQPELYSHRVLEYRYRNKVKSTIECRKSAEDLEVNLLLKEFEHIHEIGQEAKRVFISYAEEDEPFCRELRKRLRSLERKKDIFLAFTQYYPLVDKRVLSYEQFDTNSADINIVLISDDFGNNDQLHRELQHLTATSSRREIIPVHLRPNAYIGNHEIDLSDFASVPNKGGIDPYPITNWNDQDEAWLAVVSKIRELILEAP